MNNAINDSIIDTANRARFNEIKCALKGDEIAARHWFEVAKDALSISKRVRAAGDKAKKAKGPAGSLMEAFDRLLANADTLMAYGLNIDTIVDEDTADTDVDESVCSTVLLLANPIAV